MLFRREELGQTKSTTINYLKNLGLLFQNIINAYIHMDKSFPKGFDLMPCQETVTKIKLLDHNLWYTRGRRNSSLLSFLFVRRGKPTSFQSTRWWQIQSRKSSRAYPIGWPDWKVWQWWNSERPEREKRIPAKKEVCVCGKTLAWWILNDLYFTSTVIQTMAQIDNCSYDHTFVVI